MKLQKCKGSRDWLPQDMPRFRHIERTFATACLLRGYEEVRTPLLEYLHLFTSTGTLTPQMLGKVYSFLDWDGWSGQRVVLRPDGTIPVARLFVENLGNRQPSKLFYVENTFTFEESGQKSREHWQCGAELIGSAQTTADVELITLALEVLAKLGIAPVKLRLSHIGVIKALLDELGLEASAQEQLLERILDGDGQVLAQLSLSSPRQKEVMELFLKQKGQSAGFLQNLRVALAPDFNGLIPGLDNFAEVCELLSALGCDYEVDLTLGKGFEYYTGVNFQLYYGDSRIGGGGRYDNLLPLVGGEDIPASGFALYIDQLMPLLKQDSLPPVAKAKVWLQAKSGVEAQKACQALAAQLRQAGYIAEMDLGGTPTSRWVVTFQAEGQPLLLTDNSKGRKRKLASVAQVIKILEAECS